MPQAQDEAGNIWEIDAQGNPIALVSAANQPPADPEYQYAEPKARADAQRAQIGVQGDQVSIANTQSTIQDRRADNAREDQLHPFAVRKAAAEAQSAEMKLAEAARSGGDPTQAAMDSVTELDRLMQRIDSIKADADDNGGWFETGMSGGLLRETSGTAAYGLASDLKTLDANAAFRALQKMRDESPTGGALGQITEKELDLLKSTVANLDPNQPHGDFLTSLDRAKQYYQGMRDKIVRDNPDVKSALTPQNETDYSARGKQFSAAGPQVQAAQGERYSTQKDRDVAAALQKIVNSGGNVSDMSAKAREMGYPVNLQQAAEWQRALDYRDGKGEYEGQRTAIPSVSVPQSGMRSLAEQAWGSAAASGPGAFGIGVGNAASFGGLDEIAAGVNSVAKGTDYQSELDSANFGKQASAELNPGWSFAGEMAGGFGMGGATARYLPKLANEALKNTRRIAGTGAAIGATSGALENNENRVGGAAIGAGAGAAGGVIGAKVAAPLIERGMRTAPAQVASKGIRAAINKIKPQSVPAQAVIPSFKPGEAMLPPDEIASATNNLRDAERLGLPYSLADADPKLRQLAGSIARKSPVARELAEQTFEPRARGQADRLVGAIDERLAPITDVKKRSSELMKAGSDAASPYYQKAYAQNALDDPDISAMLQSPSGKDALSRAYRIAGDEGRDPAQLGFVYDESTGGVTVNTAGRVNKVRPENNDLEQTTIRGYNGSEVSKRGPTDLVGYLRQNGGLKDSGGELKHMGLTNAPRKGDMVGQEARFGPLVNDQGMNFDDAAMAAWEAGYFPELNERPSINQFLDAMRETQEGTRRRFLPEDVATVEGFEERRMQNLRIAEASREGGMYNDNSVPAGPRDFAPAEAYGDEVPLPTYETLHMVKRGFDDVVEGNRDALGNLNLQGSPALQATNSLRGRFNDRLKSLNPDYAAGNAEFAKFAKRRDALQQGFGTLPRSNVPPRDFNEAVGRARAYDDDFKQNEDRLIPEMQRGYATSMADQADKMRFSGNPYDAVYGSPAQQQKVGELFPEGAQDFSRIYGLERDMAKTSHETLGGSPTAARAAADEQFDGPGMLALDAGVDAAITGGLNPRTWMQLASQMGKDNLRTGFSQKKAEAIAPVLFKNDPATTLRYIDDLTARQKQLNDRKDVFRRRTGLFGAVAPVLAAEQY